MRSTIQQTIIMLKFAILVAFSLVAFASADSKCDQYDNVNSFIGTSGPAYGYGAVNPGAQVPFGPFRLGPDTMTTPADIGYRHFSGYNYLDTTIRGFSHTHVVGAGVNDLGTFGVMPFRVGKQDTLDFDPSKWDNRFWWSKFNKTSETASPGMYSVFLDKPQVQAELLAVGTHAGIHKYTWNEATEADARSASFPGLLIDMCHAAELSTGHLKDSPCVQASLDIDAEKQTFSGSVLFSGSLSRGVWMYIHGEIRTNRPTVKVDSWNTCVSGDDSKITCSKDTLSAATATHTLFSSVTMGPTTATEASPDASSLFWKQPLEVELRVGLSFISKDLAKENLHATIPDKSTFAELKTRTRDLWCSELSFLSVTPQDGDADMAAILASANYRSHMSPTTYTETGGVYLGLDNVVHNVVADRIARYGDISATSPRSYQYYSDLSLWDTFRTQHPWLLLVDEDLAVGIARSTADITAQQGAFPKWVMANHEAGCMIGNSGSALVLEAIGSGLADQFDVNLIQQALQKQSTQQVPVNGRSDVDFYMTNGYVSLEASDVSASLTMTDAYDDWVLAGISAYTGATADAAAALNRSTNYRNIWNPELQYICPRSKTGEWKCAKSPTGPEAWQSFVEGDALHWSWFVPHDPVGLMSLFPSPQVYDAKLSEFFEKHVAYHETFGSAVPNPYFWAGNEHDAFAPFMFNYGPNCTRTQYWSRRVTHLSFSNTPFGNPGNEDYGAMSSWIMFASLGIFPQAGTTNYLIGSPRVSQASLSTKRFTGESSVLNIVTYNNSPDNVFVEKLLVNGQLHSKPIIDRSVLTAVGGCKLEFFMSATPVSGLCL